MTGLAALAAMTSAFNSHMRQNAHTVVTYTVVRWQLPTATKWCHDILLDFAKNFVTNFQLKSAKSSESLPKNLLRLR